MNALTDTRTGTYRLVVALEFAASHQLRHYQGECENLHGHNFLVEAAVEGERLSPRTGILIDFKELKQELRGILDAYDHAHLNDLPEFCEDNPSSEHIARHIFEKLSRRMLPYSVRVAWVKVSETPGASAIYSLTDTPGPGA